MGRHLLNLYYVYNVQSKRLVSTPTRVTANSHTLIDVILTFKRIKSLHESVFNPDITDDHLVCAIKRAACPKRGPKTFMSRNFEKFNSVRYNDVF